MCQYHATPQLSLVILPILSFSGLYFPVFRLNTGKYGPEKTPYLDTFHVVYLGAMTENNILGADQKTIIIVYNAQIY